MPTFNLLLAHDVGCYASVEIEADTFAEAVRTVERCPRYFSGCRPDWHTSYDHRIVEASVGESVLADDISIDCTTMSITEAVNRLRELASDEGLRASQLRAKLARLADRWDSYRKPDPRAVSRADRELKEDV